jgi:hypothetical protein
MIARLEANVAPAAAIETAVNEGKPLPAEFLAPLKGSSFVGELLVAEVSRWLDLLAHEARPRDDHMISPEVPRSMRRLPQTGPRQRRCRHLP